MGSVTIVVVNIRVGQWYPSADVDCEVRASAMVSMDGGYDVSVVSGEKGKLKCQETSLRPSPCLSLHPLSNDLYPTSSPQTAFLALYQMP